MTDDYVNEFLDHHGVKGMRWGVVKKDETSDGESAVQKALKANPPKKLSADQKKQLAKHQKEHESHFDPSEETTDSKKGWRPTKKQAVLIGVGAVVAAGIVAGTVYKVKTGNKLPGFSQDDYLKAVRSAETPGWINGIAGTHMSPTDYKGLVGNSTGRVWTGQYLTRESFARKEINYSKGHKFLRISRKAETSFGHATYSVADEADFGRYLSSFGNAFDRDARRISFEATDAVNIPDATTSLNVLHGVLRREGKKAKPNEVIDHYSAMSGGGWSSPRSKTFISELIARGYHGVVDEMDAGVYGETPLVLFDKTRFGPKSSEPIQSLNLKKYTDELVDISNRR